MPSFFFNTHEKGRPVAKSYKMRMLVADTVPNLPQPVGDFYRYCIMRHYVCQ